MSNTPSVENPIATARKISPLRQRMIDDMTVRNFAPNTITCYLKQVSYFAQHFGKSPDRLGPEEIRSYQIYLAKERKVGISSRTVAVSALRFLYHVTLKQDRVIETIPFPKRECPLPVIVSPEEVLRLLEAAPSLTHQVIFSTLYGTGLRVSEALHLRVPDLDSQRMMIRIEQGKGHRDRYVPLSPKLLELLRTYWRKTTTAALAVPRTVSQPTPETRGRQGCHCSSQRARWPEETDQPALASSRLRRALTRSRNRHTQDPAPAGPSQSLYHGPLSPSGHDHGLRHHQSFGSSPAAHR
jgi:integrase/recombinase XerD